MNWLKALELGHGDWLFLVMGRDRINGKYIPKLIEYLELAEKEGITYLYDGYSKKGKVIMYTGIKAMMRFIAYDHPTGSIFNGRLFRAIPDRESYFINSPEPYPENYLRRDLLLQGKGAQIVSGVYISPSYMIDFSQVKSTMESDKDLYDMWYAPKRRTNQTLEIIDMVELGALGKFTRSELDQFFGAKLQHVLYSVSMGWRKSCGSEVMQAHYGQKVKHVGIPEMARNLMKCCRDVKAHLIEKGTCSRKRQMIIYRSVLKVSTRELFRLILENLGIWSALRFVKHLIIRR